MTVQIIKLSLAHSRSISPKDLSLARSLLWAPRKLAVNKAGETTKTQQRWGRRRRSAGVAAFVGLWPPTRRQLKSVAWWS